MKKLLPVILLLLSATVYSQNADIRILSEINLNRNRDLDKTFRAVSNTAAPVAFGTPVVMFAVSLINDDSLMRKNSLYIGASVLSSAIITSILKYSVGRPRPYITYPYIEKAGDGGSPAFPSGHTSVVCFSNLRQYCLSQMVYNCSILCMGRCCGLFEDGPRCSLSPSDVIAGALIKGRISISMLRGQKWLDRKRLYRH